MSRSSNGFSTPTLHEVVPQDGEQRYRAPNSIIAARDFIDARSEEIAVICHELRNSLAVVRRAARLLRSPAASDGATARALIDRHVGHMSRHVEDLLEPLRRAGRGHGLQLAHIDLRLIARYAAEAIGPEMTRRGHRLTVKLPDEPVWAHADGARVEQAFSNLLINAAKYTPDGGNIALAMECDHDVVRVRVRDSGIGIEAAMLSRVFAMFVRTESATARAEAGHGIGLAVVRSLVELHGGSVKAASAGLGLGSEFTIVLPALSTRL